MSISEKLVTIAENQQRVFDAGRNSGGGGDYDSGYNDGYSSGYSDGETSGWDNGYSNGWDNGYSDGQQAENESFWNNYLRSDVPWSFAYGFAGSGWCNNTFKPPYGSVIAFDKYHSASVAGLFQNCAITDLKSLCAERNVTIDFSAATSFVQFLCDSNITVMSTIDTRGAANLDYFFFNATKLASVEKVILKSDGSQTFNTAFNSCRQLQDVIFEGVIGQAIDLQWSTKLTRVSIESIINALSTTASGQTLTLSKTAVDNAFWEPDGAGSTGSESHAWYLLTESVPNWTISLV